MSDFFKEKKNADVRCVFLLRVRSSSLSGNDAMDINFRLTSSHVMDADRTQDFSHSPPALKILRFAFFLYCSKNNFTVVVFLATFCSHGSGIVPLLLTSVLLTHRLTAAA